MNKLRILPLLAFAIAVLCFAGSQTKTMAQATTITTQASFPVSYEAVPCGGDVVNFSGDMHFLFHITNNASGGRQAVLVMNTQGVKGIGLLGYEYIANTTVTEKLIDPQTVDGKLIYTSTAKYMVVGKGNRPDFMVRTQMHLTVNDDGTATPSTPEFTVRCS